MPNNKLKVIPHLHACAPINRFNPAIFLHLTQVRTWISNVICRGLFSVQ